MLVDLIREKLAKTPRVSQISLTTRLEVLPYCPSATGLRMDSTPGRASPSREHLFRIWCAHVSVSLGYEISMSAPDFAGP